MVKKHEYFTVEEKPYWSKARLDSFLIKRLGLIEFRKREAKQVTDNTHFQSELGKIATEVTDRYNIERGLDPFGGYAFVWASSNYDDITCRIWQASKHSGWCHGEYIDVPEIKLYSQLEKIGKIAVFAKRVSVFSEGGTKKIPLGRSRGKKIINYPHNKISETVVCGNEEDIYKKIEYFENLTKKGKRFEGADLTGLDVGTNNETVFLTAYYSKPRPPEKKEADLNTDDGKESLEGRVREGFLGSGGHGRRDGRDSGGISTFEAGFAGTVVSGGDVGAGIFTGAIFGDD